MSEKSLFTTVKRTLFSIIVSLIITFFVGFVGILVYQYQSHAQYPLYCETNDLKEFHREALVDFVEKTRRESGATGFEAPIMNWWHGKNADADSHGNVFDALIDPIEASTLPRGKLPVFIKSSLFKYAYLISNVFPQKYVHSIRMIMDTAMGLESQMRFKRENEKYAWIGDKSTFRMRKETFKSKISEHAPQEDLYAWVYYDEASQKAPGNGVIAVFMHGGGWTVGLPEHHHIFCLELLRKLPVGSVIVNLHYRLAPEYKYPVALEDCVEGLKWVAENAPKRYPGASANRIVALGDSAGGTQVLSSVLKIRDDRINSVNVRFQILIYPCAVYYLHERNRTPSAQAFRFNGFFIDEAFVTFTVMHYAPEEYLNNTAKGFHDPYLSPLIGSDFHGLPPTFIYSAEYDMLRSEGSEIAAKMREEGVAVEQFVDPNTVHGQLNMDPQRISTIVAAKVHAFFEQNIFVE